MQVDSFPELLDLIARWAPAMQAAAISYVLREMNKALDDYGFMEELAARVAHGADHVLARLRRERLDRPYGGAEPPAPGKA